MARKKIRKIPPSIRNFREFRKLTIAVDYHEKAQQEGIRDRGKQNSALKNKIFIRVQGPGKLKSVAYQINVSIFHFSVTQKSDEKAIFQGTLFLSYGPRGRRQEKSPAADSAKKTTAGKKNAVSLLAGYAEGAKKWAFLSFKGKQGRNAYAQQRGAE